MRRNLVGWLSLIVIGGLLITACSPADIKEISVSTPAFAEDKTFEIHPDYSTNWWKSQPNGNSTIDPDWGGEGWLLTANEVSEGLVVSDIKTGKPIKYFQGAGTPHHVHLNKDMSRAFVTQRYGTTMLTIDMETLELEEIEFPGVGLKPGPLHLGFTHDGSKVFASLNQTPDVGGAIAEIDANTGELVQIIEGVGNRPRDIGITPDDKKLFISLQSEPYITVVDLDTYEMRKLERTQTDYGEGSGSGIDVSNDGKYVAVGNTPDNEIAIYDAETEELIKKIEAPVPVNISFMGNSPYLTSGNRGDGSTTIVNTDTWESKTIKTGSGTNIGYLGPDGLWYFSQNGEPYVTVIDPEDKFRIIRKTFGVQNIHWLMWGPDGKTMFGTNWGDRSVTNFDMTKPKHFRETIDTGLNPNGMALKTDVSNELLEKYRSEENVKQVSEELEKARTLVIPDARNEGEEAFLNTCLNCHDVGRILRNNATGDAWQEVVDRMEGNGAIMTPEEKEAIVNYLKEDQHSTLDIKTEKQLELEEEEEAKTNGS